MKWLKLFLISVFFFAFMLWAFSWLLPSKVFVSRALRLNVSAQKALPYIYQDSLLLQWNSYAQGYIGKDRKTTGQAVFELNYLLHTPAGEESGTIVIEGAGSQTSEVRWTQWKKARYPWQKFTFFYQDKIYGAAFEKGLLQLKWMVEQ